MDYYARFPSFSSENLPIWFAQMESTFALNGISDDSEKYACVLVYVPSEALRIVEDIILNPPTTDQYKYLKNEFIKRMMIKKLVKVEFGNETPSAYLRKLKDIAGQRVSNEEILNLWLNNLPDKVRQIVNLRNNGNMDSLCEIADKAIVLMTPASQNSTATESKSKEDLSQLSHMEWCEMMKSRMNNLLKELEDYMINKYDKNHEDDVQETLSQESILKGQKETINTSNRNSTTSSSKKMCWYHTKFGDNAVTCVAPCQYKTCCPARYLYHNYFY